MKKWDLALLEKLFLQAGDIALEYFQNPPAELKSDESVVTLADKKIEELFTRYCDHAAEQVYLIGEETVATHDEEYILSALNSDCCWVLDPIDGTMPYSIQLPMWGISLGLMQNKVITEGAVYLPVLDKLLLTDGEKLLIKSLRRSEPWQEFKPAVSPLGNSGHIAIGQYPAHHWRFTSRNQICAWSSCVGSFYWLLTGKVSAYCGNFKLWDIAGLLPIMQRANYPVLSVEEPHIPLDCDLNKDMFELTDTPDRWRVRVPIITACNKSTALEFLSKIHRTATLKD